MTAAAQKTRLNQADTGWTDEDFQPQGAVAEIARLRATLIWVRANYASGSTAEINARIDAALAA